MTSFDDDLPFYNSYITANSSLLELGCGSGRLTQRLAPLVSRILGVDISLPMLQRAMHNRHPSHVDFVCMNMAHLGLQTTFDTVVIPYNTLNLLVGPGDVLRTLRHARRLLRPSGYLLLQLYIPEPSLLNDPDKKIFQFQIFDRPGNGRLIKEVIRNALPDRQQIRIVERYRVRPTRIGEEKEDLIQEYSILASPAEHWLALLGKAGFTDLQLYGDYDQSAYVAKQSSCLLITAR